MSKQAKTKSPQHRVPLLELEGLATSFFTQRGEVQAVRGVSLQISPGKILGIVGESGSGKSITCMSILRLLKSSGKIIGGKAMFEGTDLFTLKEEEMRQLRGNDIAVIFQDPMTSLNPTMSVGDQVMETILRHKNVSKAEARARTIELFELVRIPSPESRLNSYPHEFSGGMRQRVMIAIALSCDPKLLIADEPTTALDVTIQRQILTLIKDIQARMDMAVILITHDLGVIAEVTDRVLVMYGGLVMEEGRVNDIFANPRHPYTQGLMASIPDMSGKRQARLQPIPGSPPDMNAPPTGCPFSPRCEHVRVQCSQELPPLYGREDANYLVEGQSVRCWLHHSDAPFVEGVNSPDLVQVER